uniref:Uncharacterized protein n=1 Tax=Aegilops tauschii TaxID=37682 RepID=M8CCV2_AEGTA
MADLQTPLVQPKRKKVLVDYLLRFASARADRRFPLTVAPCKRRLKGEGEFVTAIEGLKEVHVEEGRQKQ